MNERIFCIGDIHGNYEEFHKLFKELVKEANLDLTKDHLVLVGDIVDSGLQAKEVIEWCQKALKEYPETVHVLKGNHEDMLVDAFSKNHPKYGDYYIWWNQGGKETLESFYPKNADAYEKAIMQPENVIGRENIDWLAHLPLYWQTEKYFFVHAGLPPFQKITEINLEDPYIQDQMLWIREQFYQSEWDFGKLIVFGHTPFTDKKGMYITYQDKYKIGINTQPRRNLGYLTALQLPEKIFYTVK